MYTNSSTVSVGPAALSDPRFIDCRPWSASFFEIEARLSRPGIVIEVQRYRWDEPLLTGVFRPAVCYLDLALARRSPRAEAAYLGPGYYGAFAPIGDCVFVPAGHEIRAHNPAVEHRVLTCMFDSERLQPYIDWTWTPLELSACFNIKNPNIRTGLARLAEEALRPGFASDVLVDATVSSLIIELARHFCGVRAPITEPRGKLSARQLRLIQERIESSAGQTPSIAALAADCGISARHMTRIFKVTTGRTLGEYIADVRVQHAKRRLCDPNALIKAVAYECGFRSQAAFAAAFRAATGWTPTQFRAQTSRRKHARSEASAGRSRINATAR